MIPTAPQHLRLGGRKRAPLTFIQMTAHQLPTLRNWRLCLHLASITQFDQCVTLFPNDPLTRTLGSTQDQHSNLATISPVVSWRMNTAAKLLASMRRSQLDWQIGDLQTVARQNNIDWRHQKSSHCVFIREDGRTLSVPAHRPIKVIYVRKFVELIDGA